MISRVPGIVSQDAHENAVRHGFYDMQEALLDDLNARDEPDLADEAHRNFVLAQLAKIASEVGEAVSAIQKNRDFAGLGEELADITIRTMDLAAYLGYDHGTDVMLKMAKNASRPYKHGKVC